MRVRAAPAATTQMARIDAEAPSTVPAPASSLRERLTRLGAPARPQPRRSYELPRGFEEMITPFGAAAVRQDVIPLPPLDPDPGGIAYVDTETTGLSGGAGTYVFAAAVARPIDCGLRVAQFFLPEPGMESAFLHALREEVEVADGLATFNGGSFDLPVLRARAHDFLEAALEHNRLDVISLVHLHSRLLRRLQGADVDMDADDWLALGRHRWRRGARADGWRALRNATAFASGEAAATAGLLISRRLLRRGSIGAADSLLAWLESSAHNDVRVSVARARLLEWRRRDPHQALSIVEAAQRRMPDHAPDLEHRRERLRRKVDSDRGWNRNRRSRGRIGQVGEIQLEAPIADSPP